MHVHPPKEKTTKQWNANQQINDHKATSWCSRQAQRHFYTRRLLALPLQLRFLLRAVVVFLVHALLGELVDDVCVCVCARVACVRGAEWF